MSREIDAMVASNESSDERLDRIRRQWQLGFAIGSPNSDMRKIQDDFCFILRMLGPNPSIGSRRDTRQDAELDALRRNLCEAQADIETLRRQIRVANESNPAALRAVGGEGGRK